MIPMGIHFAVYIPFRLDLKGAPQSKMWLCKSFEEAVETIQDFIQSSDFEPDVECNFEIFDHDLEPCGDQDAFDDMIAEVQALLEESETAGMRIEEAVDFMEQVEAPLKAKPSVAVEEAGDVGDEGAEVIEEIAEFPSDEPKREVVKIASPEPPKEDPKKVEFREIKIKDERK